VPGEPEETPEEKAAGDAELEEAVVPAPGEEFSAPSVSQAPGSDS